MELQKYNPSSKSTYTSIDVEDHHQQINKSVGDITQLVDDQNQLIMASTPFVLSFIDLSYGVSKISPKMALPFCQNNRDDHEIGTKLLLDTISGQAREGEILAVLGASGSGKSTLIDALAGRIEKESLKGAVTLNGEVLESRVLKTISAYVMQDDLLFPMLTVEETLMFSAEFRLPRSVSKQIKQARVQALIDQLGLQSVANTVIGDEGHRGVSGGERRRVSIGVDIIHDPILLFLDEPTSGLDSTSAFMVVKVLQGISKSGSIVIMSIHQPSNRIVSLLDNLIFLSRGQTIYSGKPTSLLQFFKEFGHPIPENENPIEFAIDLICEFEESSDRITSLVEFNKSWAQARTMNNPNKLCDKKPNINALEDAIKARISKGKLVSTATTSDSNSITSVPSFVNPFWIETIVIAKRLLTNSRRMPKLFAIRVFVTLVAGLMLATLYWHLDASPKGIDGRLGFSSFSMSVIFLICLEEIPKCFLERYIFMREAAFNAYRTSSYVLAHSIVSVPSLIVLSFTFVITTFWNVGLAGGFSGFLFFFFLIFASFWAGSSFMVFISGLVSRYILAVCIGALFSTLFILFSGNFISSNEFPHYWKWFHYISLVKYPYQGILQNEYGDSTKCFVRGSQFFDHTPLAGYPDSTKIMLLESMGSVLGTSVTSSTCLVNGTRVLEMKGDTNISKWTCLWITIAWGFFFMVLFYFTLLFRRNNKRR
ncbi:hypothetical protein LWI29_017809 [Acer saccharum]|uniref:ABC transporter domain-containing protein n=1 Tax=Acer saccharum TaxID=4024 RepID=A0AA39S5S3_ACESA|nr:hypothetical protein LWI29_017809 [Acer saccharum]